MPVSMNDPLGLIEVSDLLGVKRHTVTVWKCRGVMPRPDWVVNGSGAWRRVTVLAWAARSGRLRRHPALLAEAHSYLGLGSSL